MIFGRRRLPAPLRAALAPGERVVAWTRVPPSQAVVATDRALYLPDRERLGWDEIHHVTWTGRDLVVTPGVVVEEHPRYQVTADAPPVTVTLPDPGEVPAAVRARVTRSVASSSHHRVPGGGMLVVARRRPGADGLRWTVRYDHGTDPHGPGVADATAQLVDMLAASAHDPTL